VNGLCAAAVIAWTGARGPRVAARALTGALVLALLPVGWGARRAASLGEGAGGASVLALALDVPPEAAPELRAEAAVAAAERLVPGRRAEARVVALPEMAVPLDADSAPARPFLARLGALAREEGAPVLVGARGTRSARALNSALLVGGPAFRADKRRLVPGAESGAALAPAWLAPASGYARGEGWPVLRLGPLRAGVLICWEVAFASDARRLARAGARSLVVLSNDGWFGGAAGPREAGVAQQLAHLTVRAIETRRGAVRSANGGPAAEVSPVGRVRRVEPPGALLAFLPADPPDTLFLRTGDWVGPLAAAALLLALAGTSFAHPSTRESERILGSEGV